MTDSYEKTTYHTSTDKPADRNPAEHLPAGASRQISHADAVSIRIPRPISAAEGVLPEQY